MFGEFVAEVGAHAVVVNADVDGLFVGEILLVVIDEPVHLFVGAAIGDGDDLCVANFGEGEGVHFAFDDVGVGGVFDAVEIIAYLLAAGLGLAEAFVA